MIVKRMFLVVGVLATVLVSGCTVTAERNAMEKSQVVVKSPADDRDYRFVQLDNGLKALLISDPDTDKAAAAVDVKVGSYQDPDNRLGLAHFLEHMLFLGNEKYPEADGYFEYIRANGGTANAYTTDTRTNYYFDINSGKLRPALDQLAQFFVAPTLDPAYVDRERNAVDSEYKLHANEDGWRLMTALNAASNPDHPRSRFNIGSLETLSNDDGKSLWNDLKAFYDTYYVAENIGVVIYGKESTEVLETWLKESFAGVPDGQSPDTHIGLAPYTAEQLGVRINLVPLKDTRALSLSFPMSSQHENYRKKPLGYLARILGYEGEGSLHSYLKERGLIVSLASYSNHVPGEFSEFTVRMELTPKGLERVDEITANVFDYLDLIRKQGLQPRIYEEARQLAELSFRYQEDANPQQTASALATRIHDIPAEDILQASYLYEDFDRQLISDLLEQMKPSNMRQVVVARGLETDQVEPYFKTHYSMQPLSDTLVKRLLSPQVHAEMTIPKPNDFIAEDLELREGSGSNKPEVLLAEPGFKVWNMTDSRFEVPKANVRIKISSEQASATTDDVVEMQLYSTLLRRSLNEYGYPAKEAGLNYGVSSSREGLTIALSGYQDKQELLLADILKAIKQFNPDEAGFNQEKALLIRGLRNKQFQPPYRLGMDRLSQELYPNYRDDQALLAAAEKVTLNDVKQFARDFYRSIYIEMLVHGNHSSQESMKLAGLVEKALLTDDNRGSEFRQPVNLIKDSNRTITADFNHNDSLYITYYQRPGTDNRDRAVYSLLGRLLATPFFNQLRTEQQLGYIVFAGPRPVERHPGLIFVVQSPVLAPEGIEGRVEAFLLGQQERLKSLTEEELDQYRQGLLGDLLKKDANLDERSARFWQSLEGQEAGFEFHKLIAAEVETVTVKEIQQALDTILEDKGRVTIESAGKTQGAHKN
ncbi:insulinase family protein [Endozoicomonas sp. 4G]|uniref:insulinase family protein n=1 Tax=Endozoicomonas sp. 4G TaxID=2872754 RepID=UPI002078B3A3|nr:insulinase family protein [Endozoicomonas sp. 4G]